MRKFYVLGLIALAVTIIGLAWAEQMTFSTYYPAPAGVYNQMVTRCLGVGDQDGDGINYADAPDPSIAAQQNDLWVAGNVGIGTTDTSYYRIDIQDATHSAVRPKWTDTTGRGECTFWQNTTFYGSVGAFGSMYVDPLVREGLGLTSGVDNQGFIFFRTKTGNTLRDRMRITNNGNVGIGTVSPGRPLEVKGVVKTEATLLDPVNPNSISNPEDGMIACDDGIASGDTNVIKQYDSGAWNPLGGGGAQIVTGTYTGDGGASKVITGIGINPDIVVVIPLNTISHQTMIKTDTMPGSFAKYVVSLWYWDDTIRLDADGFTVYDSTPWGGHANVNAVTYSYIAIEK